MPKGKIYDGDFHLEAALASNIRIKSTWRFPVG
jgi:hypothetical protein